MGTLSDVPYVDTMANDDTFVINKGKPTRQITKADFIAGLDIPTGGGFANVIDATAGNYSLVAQSEYFETIIYMNGDELTIPSGAFEVGSIYTVNHIDGEGSGIGITLGSGVTCQLVSSGVSEIEAPNDGDGSTFARFVNIGADSWLAYGDIVGAP